MHRTPLAVAALALCLAATLSEVLPAQGADKNRVEGPQLARIDDLVNSAIAARQTPGAVVVVGQGDRTLYEKAFGARALVPAMEPMSIDTVFDVASLTKVVATTTAVMTLIEDGRLRLNDPVASHIPGFERYGKGNITIRHLLTHVSGLRPDVDLHPWTGYETAIELAKDEVPTAAPNETFVYSDINFFLLGHIVSRISGESLDAYLKRVVFEPLGMKETGFNPPQSLLARIAPTERCAGPDPGTPCKRPDAPPLRGVVHDPTARRMGGVAGHAGLFSTARDLQRFVRMLINGGELEGARILGPKTIKLMTMNHLPGGKELVESSVSLFSEAVFEGLGFGLGFAMTIDQARTKTPGSLGEYFWGGMASTAFWVDPVEDLTCVFMTQLMPSNSYPIRRELRTLVYSAVTESSAL